MRQRSIGPWAANGPTHRSGRRAKTRVDSVVSAVPPAHLASICCQSRSGIVNRPKALIISRTFRVGRSVTALSFLDIGFGHRMRSEGRESAAPHRACNRVDGDFMAISSGK